MDKVLSIISPCYNGAKYLPRFLDSILAQTYPCIELILVDDASTDDTLQVAESYALRFADRGIKYIIKTQPVNKGQAAAINVGLPIFTGDYVMWMDSDDILFPSAAEEKVAFLNDNPEYDFVLNQGIVVDENNLDQVIGTLQRFKPEGNDDLFSDMIYERNIIFGPGGICVRAEAIKEAIPTMQIFESREGQNWQLMLPLAYSCKWGYIEKPLFKYVVHSNSHSHFQRTYDQQITRYENFEILLDETLDRICTMPVNERKEWKEKIRIKYMYVKLSTASKYRLRSEYKHYKRKLVEAGLPISIFSAYNLYYIKRLFLMVRFRLFHR